MRNADGDAVVNVSTELASGTRGQPGDIYAMTKVAQNAMTRALAEDLAGHPGVSVDAISPDRWRTRWADLLRHGPPPGRREHRVGCLPSDDGPTVVSRTAEAAS